MEKIPKVINYFWFGGNELPDVLKDCIDSWKKHCPDYQLKRWDESNFDINQCDFVKQAYSQKKWAFVSDYARFYVLYKYGGVYLDTDVKLLKDITPIVNRGPFFALETDKYDSINPGLIMAANKGMPLYKKVLSVYNNKSFIKSDGTLDKTTVGQVLREILINDGLKDKNGIQSIDDVLIYPKEYFCPYNYYTGEKKITKNTYSIHLYAATWLSSTEKRHHKIGQKFSRLFGVRIGNIIEKTIDLPYQVKEKNKELGFVNTVNFLFKKLKEKL